MKRLMYSLLTLGLAMLFLTTSYAQEADLDTLRASDVNADGIVNILDLVFIATYFGETPTENQQLNPDVNGDGTVNILDLVLVAQHFGKSIDPPEPELSSAAFVSATPASGDLASNGSITITFDNDPGDVTASAGTVSGAGKTRTITGPFTPGALNLTITWTNGDGSHTLTYNVTAPDTEAPTVTGGTIEDGAEDVDPEEINGDGMIEITFSEEVAGNIALQTEGGDDVGWIGKVEGNKGTLELVKGKEIGNETTYVIKGKVTDAAGNETEISIVFVTAVGIFLTAVEDLVNYWSFDQGKGDTVTDIWSGYDGELFGGPKWVDGIFGWALEFDGVDDRVVVENYPTSDLTENMTFAAWFYPTDTLTNRAFIVEHDSFYIGFGEQNQLKFVIKPHDISVESTDLNWTPREWHHLAVTFDGKTMRIYINGELNSELPNDFPIAPSDTDLVIGRGFSGIIDEVRFYNKALSQDEIINISGEFF